MVARQLTVGGHIAVGHPPIDHRAHIDVARPVLRLNLDFQAGQVHPGQGLKLPADDLGAPPVQVLEVGGSGHQTAAHIQILVVVHQLRGPGKQRVSGLRGDLHKGPVRDVDHMLGLHRLAHDVGVQPIKDPGDVGALIVGGISAGARIGGARAPVAVGHVEQHLTGGLLIRLERIIGEHPQRVMGASGAGLQLGRREIGDHHIGTAALEPTRILTMIDADHHAEAAGPSRLHPGDRVLHHDRILRLHTELIGGVEEHVWIRFARQAQPLSVGAVDNHVERLDQPGPAQHLTTIA